MNTPESSVACFGRSLDFLMAYLKGRVYHPKTSRHLVSGEILSDLDDAVIVQ